MFPTISFFIAGLIVIAAIYLSLTTDIIKSPTTNIVEANNKKYSFARTQMMWWTVIISGCFIIMYGETREFGLNQTALILLGIGVATITGGSVIDTSQVQTAKENNVHRHQDCKSSHFLQDLLDDGHGICTHRFQALVFNVLFGLVYLVYFFSNKYTLVEFDQYQLGLIGVSSGAYLALKTNENKVPSSKTQAQTDKTQST